MAALRKTNELSRPRIEEIASLAESIADDYFPDQQIEPSLIAKKKEIGFAFNRYGDDFDGVIEHKRGRFFIYLNLDRLEGSLTARARFTFAHELGHYFIDEHRNALKKGACPSHGSIAEYQSRNPVEMEADLFASSLLMPTSRFTKRMKKLSHGWKAIDQLCKDFGTSRTSTAIKYVSLTDRPLAVVKWNRDGFGWRWLSSTFYDSKLFKTIDSISSLPEGSATLRALHGEQPPQAGFFSSGSVVSSWFPFVKGSSARNDILIEEAVPLGRFGVLTLLYPESGQLAQAPHYLRP